MVLAATPGDAGAAGIPSRSMRDERGSQTLEFALVVPLALWLLASLLLFAVVGAELVAAQGIAREAARAAAVGSDAEARNAAKAGAGSRQFDLRLLPPDGARQPGDLVSARLRLRSAVAANLGLDLWLPAHAVMRTEDVP